MWWGPTGTPISNLIDWIKQLLDGRMNLLQRAEESHDILSSALENRVPLKLRFRHNSTTVILHPLEKIEILNKKMATTLNALKEITTSITIKVFLDHEQERDSYSRWGRKQHPFALFRSRSMGLMNTTNKHS